jgi:LmbE family N-acetylglucosaminyl deacetylase
MATELRLMCVLPHPDDEALGLGFTLAKYAAEGVKTYLVTATRGERGWMGDPQENPGLDGLGRLREAELRCAVDELGITELSFLDYTDGVVDQVNPLQASGKIAAHIRRIQPQVLITFDPCGTYGHPDHIAVAQFTQAAVVLAADSSFRDIMALPPYRVPKFYFQGDTLALVELVKQRLGGIDIEVDGQTRHHFGWPDWVASARIDGSAYWDQVMRSIACHQSQVSEMLPALRSISLSERSIYAIQSFTRIHSFVNGGRRVESDLFEGLR